MHVFRTYVEENIICNMVKALFCLGWCLLWRKFRIGIHSESIRTIPNHIDICIRANANQFEPIHKTFWISFVEKCLKIILTQSETSIRMNPNELEVNFQSEWIRIKPETDWFSITTNQCSDRFELNIRFRSSRVRIDSDSFGLRVYLGFVRIHSDRRQGLNRIELD